MAVSAPAQTQPDLTNRATASYDDRNNLPVNLITNVVGTFIEKPAAEFRVVKSASNLSPRGGGEVTFTVTATRLAADLTTGIDTIVDGQPRKLILIRDAIPAETKFARFKACAPAKAIRLYHMPSMAEHTYTAVAPKDPSLVDAVALGVDSLNATLSMKLQFVVTINDGTAGEITNTAYALAPGTAVAAVASFASNVIRLTPGARERNSGIVFDSKTDKPVAGARVTLIDANTGGPAFVFKADGTTTAPNVVVTGADGRYAFPFVLPGSYRIEVLPPPGHLAPSKATAGDLPPDRRLHPDGSFARTIVFDASGSALAFDIPVDPVGDGAGLFVQKLASRAVAEIGDFVDYTVRVKNVSGATLSDLRLEDDLPFGFVLVKDSARIDGRRLRNAGGLGPQLMFSLGELGADDTATVSYRAKVGPGAMQGDGINRARARNHGTPRASSNVASVHVQLTGGTFTTRGIILGRVFVDVNGNRVFDDGDPGVPGVRLFLEDGSYVITDAEGKYNFYGISPRTHVLKLDKTTLPPDAKLAVLDNRNAGTAGSRFVELKHSELHKANFAIGNATPEILAAVEKLRDAAEAGTGELAGGLKAELRREGELLTNADPRSLPAAGVIVPGVAVQPTQHVRTESGESVILGGSRAAFDVAAAFPGRAGIPSPGTTAAPARAFESLGESAASSFPESAMESPFGGTQESADGTPTMPGATASALEERATTAGFGFLDLKNNDTLPAAQANIRVKGAPGAKISLHVNGREVPAHRVGKRITLADQSEAIEFVGIDLEPGANTLELRQMDPFGNPRGTQGITVTAPDKLGRIEIAVPENAKADGRTPALVAVRLVDANGVPVTARTELTLEASLGQWLVPDVNDRDPGTQVFIEGGRAEYPLASPVEPGESRVRISSGRLQGERRLSFLPELRPMLAAGVIEGRINISRLSASSLRPASSRDGFEEELREFSVGGDEHNASARAAFFLKGRIAGNYLLTAAYDSDKDTKDRLFRDIQPDEFYPVYGDASVKGFDAQSTGRLYVRIDNKRCYLLYGDFVTGASSEVRQLGNYNRSLNGVREHFENGRISANAWAAYDNTRQVVEELRANGTSGPYMFRTANGLRNSEKVEVITRDRNNPGLILKTEGRTRFSDYEFEPFTGRILFKAPVASLDADLNPVSIRVSYEVEQGTEKFWVYGADAQVKVTDRFEVGGAAIRDENPVNHYALYSGNAVFDLGWKTFLFGEFAASEDELLGRGQAYRVELRHASDRLTARIFWSRADERFHNPNASLQSGRIEGGAQASYRIARNTRAILQAVDTESLEGGERRGVLAAIEQTFAGKVRLEIGGRYSVESREPATATTAITPDATPNVVRSVRAKLTVPVPWTNGAARAFGEYEQDLFDSQKRLAAVGGDYQIDAKSRLYIRHELLSSLGGTFELNTVQQQANTVVGVESTYMKDASLFNEYRARNAFSGRETEAAIGLRNLWPLADGLRANTSFERIAPIEGTTLNESTAVTGALEYTANPDWKGTTRLELRKSDATDSLLSTIGVAYRLNPEWTALGRTILYVTDNKAPGSGDASQGRAQVGAAWRQATQDRWNALGKYELKVEDDGTQQDFDVRRQVHIISTDVNFQPRSDLVLTGHYAGKYAVEDSAGIESRSTAHLVAARAIYDVTKRWDVGVNTSALFSTDGGGAVRYGVGPEIGLTLADNLRVGVGYNFIGFTDRDLTEEQYTQRGFYLAMRLKFDEDLFQPRRKEER